MRPAKSGRLVARIRRTRRETGASYRSFQLVDLAGDLAGIPRQILCCFGNGVSVNVGQPDYDSSTTETRAPWETSTINLNWN